MFRRAIIREQSPGGISSLMRVWIGELVDRKFHQFPDSTDRAINYCLSNIEALITARPSPKLLLARKLLLTYDKDFKVNPRVPDPAELAS